MPFIHYLEWKNNVPFRFKKNLSGKIILKKMKKKKKKINWVYHARYLRKETQADGYKIGNIPRITRVIEHKLRILPAPKKN